MLIDTHWVQDEVDLVHGDMDGVIELSDFDGFYAAYGLTETPVEADAVAVLYATFGTPQHGARVHYCASGERVYESKLGGNIRILHRETALNGTTYGMPVRYYK